MGRYAHVLTAGTAAALTRGKKMKRLLLVILVGIIYTAMLALGAVICAAEPATNERVLNLPADEGKWFVSVVGDPGDKRYVNLLAWFDSDSTLNELKASVHFHRIDNTSDAYKSRYKKSIRSLPTVRVQKPGGFVVYESSGNNIPTTARGLSYDIAVASNMAGWQILRRPIFDGRLFPIFNRPILPWRQRMERNMNNCDTCPTPVPIVDVDVVIPEPVQPEPEPEPRRSGWLIAGLCVLCGAVGAGLGVVSQWKKLYYSEG